MRTSFYLFLLLCFSCSGADFEKSYSIAVEQYEKGRLTVAAAKLEKLLLDKSLNLVEKGRASLLLSRVYLADGKGILALKVLEGLDSGRPEDYYLALGEAFLACGKNEEASRISTYYNAGKTPTLFYPALLLSSKGQLGIKNYLECISNCRRIIAEAPKLYGYNEDTALQRTVSDARDLLKTALELYETERYGLDYVNYRKGREAENEGNFRKAMDFYAKIKSGTLKDAGRCYSGHCLVKLGQKKEALKLYDEFIEEDFKGFYRGEALYESAVLQYLDGDVEKSFKTITRLNEWLKCVKEDIKETTGINDALKSDVIGATPKTFLSLDDCGNLIRTIFFAGSINNRATAPWYLPLLSTRAHLFYAFLLGEKGEKGKSVEIYRQVEEESCKGPKTLSNDGTIPSLIFSVEKGSYLIPEESMRKIDRKFRYAIGFACFCVVSEEKERALALFGQLRENNELKNRTNEMAAVLYGIAYCLALSGKHEDALKILEEISEDPKYKSNPLSIHAAYMKGCMLSSDRKSENKAYECFEKVAKTCGDKDFAAKALLAGAVCAVNAKDKKRALNFCEALVDKYPKSTFAVAARTMLLSLKKAKDNQIMATVDGSDGKTINHSVTIIYPGSSDWNLDCGKLKEGDLIFYKIKCLARDGCSIVRSFRMDLGPCEPAPPPSNGDQLVFLRIPALFMKSFFISSREETSVQ